MSREEPKNIKIWIGRHLKVIREHRGLTKAEVARRIDCSPKTITRWESGKINNSALALILLIEKHYQHSISDLLYRGEDRGSADQDGTDDHLGLSEQEED